MSKLHTYAERVKGLDEMAELSMNVPENSRVGKRVWLKPPKPRCVTKWRPGTITRDKSEQVVEVDGMPRHVKHIRPRSGTQQTRINNVTDVEIEVGNNNASYGENMETTPAARKRIIWRLAKRSGKPKCPCGGAIENYGYPLDTLKVVALNCDP